ncbi:esterase-like activity of phytase family protein [Terasakiella sp.]|uniref:esterase-like activity of phytase family protein n=1 Tax=Terasakiella sp. TaxID=2034861 RepID=UPI003AA9C54D
MRYILFFMLVWAIPAVAEPVKVWKKEVPFAPFQNEHLKLLSVTQLEADSRAFGGLSALLKKDGRLLAVSDRAHLFQFNPDMSLVDIMPLLEKNDDELDGDHRVDSESLADAGDGLIYVSFERDDRIVPYNLAGYVMGKELPLPKEVYDLPFNDGLEAVETSSDGRLVIVAEGPKDAPSTFLWVQDGTTKWQAYKLPLSDGFRPTGLTRLPDDGRMVLLERFYRPLQGVAIRLSVLNVEIGQREKVLATLRSPTPLDNFEGIIAEKNEMGETILTLISDDNFSPLQRTLLMKLLLLR